MRDKYLFEPNMGVPPAFELDRNHIARLFRGDKIDRKVRANQAEQLLREQLKLNTQNAHSYLHQYEKKVLSGGGDWTYLKQLIQSQFPTGLQIVEANGRAEFFVTLGTNRQLVGTALLGDTRFVHLAVQPGDAGGTTVYERSGDPSGRHYIKLTTSNTFVRRFVIRGLNYTDGMNLTVGRDLIAVVRDPVPVLTSRARAGEVGNGMHDAAPNAHLSENQQIISHTRGWSGNKRYISTGVSNRPAFSTRGSEFHSIYGAVVIDLARVPSGRIFDIHRHDLAATRLGLPAQDVLNNGHHTGTNDLAEQQYLALRDVIRTRELLIKGTVPFAAIRARAVARCLVGIGSPSSGIHSRSARKVAALPPYYGTHIKNQEHLTFFDPHTGLRWHLIEFNNAALAVTARSILESTKEPGQVLVAFNQYAPDRPVGMV